MLSEGKLLGKYRHVQTHVLVTVTVLVYYRHECLCGNFPTVPHVPPHSRCQVNQYVIYPVVEINVPVIEVHAHEYVHCSGLVILRR